MLTKIEKAELAELAGLDATEELDESTENDTEEIAESGEFILRKPLKVNGEAIKAIPYDFSCITAKDIMQVSRDLKAKGVVVMMAQFDEENLLNLFAKAVSKVNSLITLNDLMRVCARDALKITKMVRSFFYSEDSEDIQES